MHVRTWVSLLLIAALLFTAGCAQKTEDAGAAVQQPEAQATAEPTPAVEPTAVPSPENEDQTETPAETMLPGYTQTVPMSDVDMEKEAVIFSTSR